MRALLCFATNMLQSMHPTIVRGHTLHGNQHNSQGNACKHQVRSKNQMELSLWSQHWGRNVSHHSAWLPLLQRPPLSVGHATLRQEGSSCPPCVVFVLMPCVSSLGLHVLKKAPLQHKVAKGSLRRKVSKALQRKVTKRSQATLVLGTSRCACVVPACRCLF